MTKPPPPNTLYIEVSGAGLPEVDGLYVPSTAPPQESESGTLSSPGYWNGRRAWDRADGKAERSPAISYSNSYRSWRICRLDGHLAYDFTCEDDLPPDTSTGRQWHVYKKGVAPPPDVRVHYLDPREPVPRPGEQGGPVVVFVLGGPGTGKGTMCELAELQLGWTHLSVGALLREFIESGGEGAAELGKTLAGGNLAGDDVVVAILKAAIERTMRTTGRRHFLVDGFPRSAGNLEAWRGEFGEGGGLPTMLYLDCPVEVLEKRVLARAKYTGRADDNAEALKQRVETFRSETRPMADVFGEAGRRVDIDAGRDRQDVYAAFAGALSVVDRPSDEEPPLSERAEMLLGIRPWPKKKS